MFGAIVVALNIRSSVPSETDSVAASPSVPVSTGVETVQLFSALGSGRNTDALAVAPSNVWRDVKVPTIKTVAKPEPALKKGRSKPGSAKVPIRQPATHVSDSGHIL